MFDMPESTTHREGVDWVDAPLPPRFHKCFVQTSGWIGLEQVQRCACGAIRNPRFGGGWIDVNSRRKDEPQSKPSASKFGWTWVLFAAAIVFVVCAGLTQTILPLFLTFCALVFVALVSAIHVAGRS